MALPKYPIPKDLKNAIKEVENAVSADNIDKINKFSLVLNELKKIDCLEIVECHYLQFLKLGLYLEEYQQRKDLNKFEICRSVIKRVDNSDNKFKINIKNLDEDNTVLNPSDSLKVFEYNDPNTVYFLKIASICKDHIIVTASKRFCENYTSIAKYNIILTFNTHTFQCCHYALSAISSSMISDYFFPKKKSDHSLKSIHKQYWFNRNVFSNPEQNQAVLNILSKSLFPAPYILYGPPGTGKTSTLVEAICQIWKLFDVRILLCTPSNAACDVITKRLLDYIPADNVYRMYSHSQEYTLIDDDIKNCCNYDDDGTTDDLKKVDFNSKKIIVTTLCTSLRLEKLGMHFSYLFIDEAGQATQPEALISLCTVKTSPFCQIVLSGDHQQLGPGIRSKLAEPLLGQSILEKLMMDEPYKKDEKTGYDPCYITKLIRNFRSNKDVLHVSNTLFYDNELITYKNKTKMNSFPVAFYSVEAMEQKSSNSRSSYNEAEIKEVLNFTQNFIGKKVGDKIINEKDIGIITPFSLQASRIRQELNNIGLNKVEVGTVEIYQGQEKEIIIITTVRSKTFVHDGVQHIGFLSNPRRFNVALTRAKSCLIIVGNPDALKTNKYWRYFLRFCQKNNACRGDVFEIMEENFYSLQELPIESKIKKSADLFDKTFTILKIDDGQKEIVKENNNSIRKSSLTINNCKMPLSNLISDQIIPATTGGMRALMRDICFIQQHASKTTRSTNPSKNHNAIWNIPVTTVDVTLPEDILKLQNGTVKEDILSLNKINSVQNNLMTTEELNMQTRNVNSIHNNPLKTVNLSTLKNNNELISYTDNNFNKYESDQKVPVEIKKSLCIIS